MTDHEDRDARERILRRRAKFVALALAAAQTGTQGCGLIADVDYEPPPDDGDSFERDYGTGGGVNTGGSGAAPNACLGISAGSGSVVFPDAGAAGAGGESAGGANSGDTGTAGQGGVPGFGYCLSFK